MNYEKAMHTVAVLVIEDESLLAKYYLDLFYSVGKDLWVQKLSSMWDISEDAVWLVLDNLKEMGLITYYTSPYNLNIELLSYDNCIDVIPQDKKLKPDFLRWRNKYFRQLHDNYEVVAFKLIAKEGKGSGKKYTQKQLEEMWCKAMQETRAKV